MGYRGPKRAGFEAGIITGTVGAARGVVSVWGEVGTMMHGVSWV